MTSTSVVQSTSLREAFGKALVELAADNEFLVCDADVCGGTGVHHFRAAYPDRFFQYGIAEQNMMGSAAGLNIATGLPVFVTGFATFLMRGWEMARLSIDYPDRNVKIIASHGGTDTGEDGHSAQCLEDLACWRTLPNFFVFAPSSPAQLRAATRAILEHKGPVYMRTGRSPSHNMPFEREFRIGQSYTVWNNTLPGDKPDIAIIATGKMTWYAIKTAERLAVTHMPGLGIRVIDMPTISPIDHTAILKCCNEVKFIVTMEDHSIRGGLGGAVAEAVTAQRHPIPVITLGMNGHGESGEAEELMRKNGLMPDQMEKEIAWEYAHL